MSNAPREEHESGDVGHSCCCGHSRRAFIKSSAGIAAAVGLMGASEGLAATAKQDQSRRALGSKTAARTNHANRAIASVPTSGRDIWGGGDWNPGGRFLELGEPLRVQPILMYAVAQRREKTSWRSWGGVLSDETAMEESERISSELSTLSANAEFPIEILPVKRVKSNEEAAQALENDHDVALVFPASGSGRLLQACVPPEGDAIIFVRKRSGPVYYWYEALSVAYLQTSDEPSGEAGKPRLGRTHVDDVVVDDYDDVLWRLRALYGVKNLTGSRIVALGGVWGKYAGDAPQIAREKLGMEIIEIGYDEFTRRAKSVMADTQAVSRAEQWTDAYLSLPNTTLQTDRSFVVNSFLLYGVFKDLMRENHAPAFTVRECMSTLIPIADTTACLTLSLLNDEGFAVFCESDFVVIPAGILLRHISGKPVFLHNSTFPHKGLVTCAHCTAPRRMDGANYEPVLVLTHEESDYGAAPKVEIPIGQELSFIDPEYTVGRWVGMRGNVEENPFYEICRSQQDVRIQGDWKRLLHEVRDSHWLMTYGDYLKEVGYAARKMGLRWDYISDV